MAKSLRPFAYLGVLVVVLAFMASHGTPPAAAQSPSPPTPGVPVLAQADAAGAATAAEDAGIDWMDKIKQGGWTMVALVVLSIVMVVFILERLLAVRAKHIAPQELSRKVHRAVESGDNAAALAACEQHPSTLGNTYRYIFDHRDNPVDTISAGAGDIAGREVRDMLARTYPLAVIASLAPLLGLLGTMIGMIEAFDKVAYYGDDANASLLADSISKALITTAVGLILAIPAIAVYHFFKYRINGLTGVLETEVESVINHLYLKGETGESPEPGDARPAPVAAVHADAKGTRAHVAAPTAD